MIMEVWDNDRFGKDDFIGSTTYDLHTLASGPISHVRTLTTRSGEKAGVIKFDFVFKHLSDVKVTFRKVEILNIQNIDVDDPHCYINFEPISDVKYNEVESKVSEGREPYWETIDPLIFEAISLQKFVTQGMHVKVYHSRKVVGHKMLGEAKVYFKEYMKKGNFSEKKITIDIKDKNGRNIGLMGLMLDFHHLPRFAQFINGLENNNVVTGTPLFGDLERPEGYKGQPTKARGGGGYVGQNVGYGQPQTQPQVQQHAKTEPSMYPSFTPEVGISPEFAHLFGKTKPQTQTQPKPQVRQNYTQNQLPPNTSQYPVLDKGGNKFYNYYLQNQQPKKVDGYLGMQKQPQQQHGNKFLQAHYQNVQKKKVGPSYGYQQQPQQKFYGGGGNKFMQYTKQQQPKPQPQNKFMNYQQKVVYQQPQTKVYQQPQQKVYQQPQQQRVYQQPQQQRVYQQPKQKVVYQQPQQQQYSPPFQTGYQQPKQQPKVNYFQPQTVPQQRKQQVNYFQPQTVPQQTNYGYQQQQQGGMYQQQNTQVNYQNNVQKNQQKQGGQYGQYGQNKFFQY